jgi:hypothetical protein
MKKLLFALPFLILFGSAFAQENIPIIQVEGTSELSIMPDEALMFINFMRASRCRLSASVASASCSAFVIWAV